MNFLLCIVLLLFIGIRFISLLRGISGNIFPGQIEVPLTAKAGTLVSLLSASIIGMIM